MRKLQLSLVCGNYDITRGLWEGSVNPDGMDLTVLTQDRDRIFRIARRNEVDVAEFNVMEFFRACDLGEPIVGLPIFPHRRFRHGFIFINTASGIQTPEDLNGKRFGVSGRNTAAAVIWVRGILNEHLGVPYGAVEWIDPAGLLGPKPKEGSSEDTVQLLLDGEVDATITAANPRPFLNGDERIARLIPDPKQAEIEYYRKTGIFPIMHIVTIKREILDEHPWVASSLAKAFQESKQAAYDRLRNPRSVPLAFVQSALEEQFELLGPDPWAYGLTPANRTNLEVAARYAFEQGRVSTMPNLDEIIIDLDKGAFTGGPPAS